MFLFSKPHASEIGFGLDDVDILLPGLIYLTLFIAFLLTVFI
jgi:hypothetical protein